MIFFFRSIAEDLWQSGFGEITKLRRWRRRNINESIYELEFAHCSLIKEDIKFISFC